MEWQSTVDWQDNYRLVRPFVDNVGMLKAINHRIKYWRCPTRHSAGICNSMGWGSGGSGWLWRRNLTGQVTSCNAVVCRRRFQYPISAHVPLCANDLELFDLRSDGRWSARRAFDVSLTACKLCFNVSHYWIYYAVGRCPCENIHGIDFNNILTV